MENLSILLLQARHDGDPMREQEQRCFANKIGLEPGQVACWDLLKGPPAFSIVSSHDFLMIGGSGDFLVSERDLPQFSALLALLVEVTDRGFPTFASCFGFQCMVEALGGKIVYDPENTEVGTYGLTLTEEGTEDPVLGGLPLQFDAQMGRKDRAETLPGGVLHLATSDRCPYQAFRIPDKPIWATQFHPELSGEENRERYIRYVSNYEHHVDDATREATLERFHPSPHTEGMLGRFVELVSA
jgi:GMP synthase (glutamine-hydrolysing)